MTVPQWKRDDRPSAGKLNELGDLVREASDPAAGRNPPPTTKTLVAILELTEDITYPDSGDSQFPGGWKVPPDVPYAENCKKIWLKNVTNEYVTLGSEEDTVYFPTITEFTQGDPPAFTTGDRVAAVWNSQSGRWEVVGAITDNAEVWVELKNKMPSSGAVAAGQSTVVHPRDWNGSAWVTDTDAARELTAIDTLGVYRGRGKDDFTTPHNQGSLARIVLNSDSNLYEFRDMTPHATWIRGLSDAAWTTPSTLFIATTGLNIMQPSGAIFTNNDPAVKITVNDVRDWEGASGVIVEAFWDESTQEFKARMVPCVA